MVKNIYSNEAGGQLSWLAYIKPTGLAPNYEIEKTPKKHLIALICLLLFSNGVQPVNEPVKWNICHLISPEMAATEYNIITSVNGCYVFGDVGSFVGLLVTPPNCIDR